MARLKYLLDTHALIWAAVDEDRLGTKAVRAITTTPYEQLAISDVTLQEIGFLLHGRRISFKNSANAALGPLLDYVTVLPITLEIALSAPALKLPHGDQFDRIIAATARAHKVTLVTKDGNLADSGVVATIW